MAGWKKYQEDATLFLEAGFIAVNQADEDSALKLFKASELLNKESILPKLGVGYLHLHKLDLKKACDTFEEVLAKEPDNGLAKTLLGIALSLGPNTLEQGERVLMQTQKSSDPMIKQLSGTAMSFVETCLKKPMTPAEAQRHMPPHKPNAPAQKKAKP